MHQLDELVVRTTVEIGLYRVAVLVQLGLHPVEPESTRKLVRRAIDAPQDLLVACPVVVLQHVIARIPLIGMVGQHSDAARLRLVVVRKGGEVQGHAAVLGWLPHRHTATRGRDPVFADLDPRDLRGLVEPPQQPLGKAVMVSYVVKHHVRRLDSATRTAVRTLGRVVVRQPQGVAALVDQHAHSDCRVGSAMQLDPRPGHQPVKGEGVVLFVPEVEQAAARACVRCPSGAWCHASRTRMRRRRLRPSARAASDWAPRQTTPLGRCARRGSPQGHRARVPLGRQVGVDTPCQRGRRQQSKPEGQRKHHDEASPPFTTQRAHGQHPHPVCGNWLISPWIRSPIVRQPFESAIRPGVYAPGDKTSKGRCPKMWRPALHGVRFFATHTRAGHG